MTPDTRNIRDGAYITDDQPKGIGVGICFAGKADEIIERLPPATALDLDLVDDVRLWASENGVRYVPTKVVRRLAVGVCERSGYDPASFGIALT